MKASHTWTHNFMLVLTAVAMGLCVVGFIGPAVDMVTGHVATWPLAFGVGLGLVGALALALSNCFASNAATFWAGRKKSAAALPAFVLSVGACAAGAVISAFAMHAGWGVFTAWVPGLPLPSDDQMWFAFGFVGVAKPIANFSEAVIKALDNAETERLDDKALDRGLENRKLGVLEQLARQGNVPAATAMALAAALLGGGSLDQAIDQFVGAPAQEAALAPPSDEASSGAGAFTADAEADRHGDLGAPITPFPRGPKNNDAWARMQALYDAAVGAAGSPATYEAKLDLRLRIGEQLAQEGLELPRTTRDRWFEWLTELNGDVPLAQAA